MNNQLTVKQLQHLVDAKLKLEQLKAFHQCNNVKVVFGKDILTVVNTVFASVVVSGFRGQSEDVKESMTYAIGIMSAILTHYISDLHYYYFTENSVKKHVINLDGSAKEEKESATLFEKIFSKFDFESNVLLNKLTPSKEDKSPKFIDGDILLKVDIRPEDVIESAKSNLGNIVKSVLSTIIEQAMSKDGNKDITVPILKTIMNSVDLVLNALHIEPIRYNGGKWEAYKSRNKLNIYGMVECTYNNKWNLNLDLPQLLLPLVMGGGLFMSYRSTQQNKAETPATGPVKVAPAAGPVKVAPATGPVKVAPAAGKEAETSATVKVEPAVVAEVASVGEAESRGVNVNLPKPTRKSKKSKKSKKSQPQPPKKNVVAVRKQIDKLQDQRDERQEYNIEGLRKQIAELENKLGKVPVPQNEHLVQMLAEEGEEQK